MQLKETITARFDSITSYSRDHILLDECEHGVNVYPNYNEVTLIKTDFLTTLEYPSYWIAD